MLVSELEKNADMRINTASTEKRRPSGASFKSGSYSKNNRKRILKKKRMRSKS
ncbi:MAG: hypothetical protein ACJA09_001265 [Alcanivorax sp.]|jgi:hypothetical protein